MDLDFQKYQKEAFDWIIAFTPSLILAVLILIIGFKIANKADVFLEKALSGTSFSEEIKGFIGSMLSIAIKIGVLLIAAGFLGFETANLLGIIAAASFAVGFALQGSLSNLAAGILILVFKPFKVGDWISASDVFGQVETIQILSSSVVSPGHKTHIIPNAEIISNVVTNYSSKGIVRLELNIPIAYESSFPKVKSIIYNVLMQAENVEKSPEPQIGIETYDSHNIILTVRPFVHPDNYWDATFELNEKIKTALSRNNIPVAYSEGIELGKIGE